MVPTDSQQPSNQDATPEHKDATPERKTDAAAPAGGALTTTPSAGAQTRPTVEGNAPASATKPAPTVSIPNMLAATDSTSRPPLFSRQLFVIVTVLLAIQLALLVGNLWFQYHNYATGIALAERAGGTADTLSLILIYSRAWDFAVTKTSALFLGFLVIYTGALYVLRSADTAYELSVTQGAQSGATLKSSSPGLVMITLGSLLVALVLQHKSEVGLQVTPNTAGSEGAGVTISANTSSTVAGPSGGASGVSLAAPTAPAPAARPTAPARPAAAPGTATPAAAGAASATPEDRRMPKLLDAE